MGVAILAFGQSRRCSAAGGGGLEAGAERSHRLSILTAHLTPRRALGLQAPASQGFRGLRGSAAGQGGRYVELDVSRSRASVEVLEMGYNVARLSRTEAGGRGIGLSLEL